MSPSNEESIAMFKPAEPVSNSPATAAEKGDIDNMMQGSATSVPLKSETDCPYKPLENPSMTADTSGADLQDKNDGFQPVNITVGDGTLDEGKKTKNMDQVGLEEYQHGDINAEMNISTLLEILEDKQHDMVKDEDDDLYTQPAPHINKPNPKVDNPTPMSVDSDLITDYHQPESEEFQRLRLEQLRKQLGNIGLNKSPPPVRDLSDCDSRMMQNDQDLAATIALALKLSEEEGGYAVQEAAWDPDMLKAVGSAPITEPATVDPFVSAVAAGYEDEEDASFALILQLAQEDGGLEAQLQMFATHQLKEAIEEPRKQTEAEKKKALAEKMKKIEESRMPDQYPKECLVCKELNNPIMMLQLPCGTHFICPQKECLEASILGSIKFRKLFTCCETPLRPETLLKRPESIELPSELTDDYTILNEELNNKAPLYCSYVSSGSTEPCGTYIPVSITAAAKEKDTPAQCVSCNTYTCVHCGKSINIEHNKKACEKLV